MAVYPVVAKAIIPVVTKFSNLLLITVSSDPLIVTDAVPKISGMDHNTFTLVRVEVPTFRDPFWSSVDIQFIYLTSLSHLPIHTWLHPVFYLFLLFLCYLTKKIKKIKFS